MTGPSNCFVLVKELQDGSLEKVLGVYGSREDLLARVERIKKANSQYPTQSLSENAWQVGPTEDEGFFGNKPITIRCLTAQFHPGQDPEELHVD